MRIRFASALLALALPLAAQDAPSQHEAIFYKAFYLEKGPRDFAGAMALYEQFLAAAPDHKLAAEAARQQFGLLDRTGKTKERDAFKEKYGKLLGNVAAAGPGEPLAGDRPGRGVGGERPARGAGGAGERPDPAARIAELEKALEKAKAEGNEDEARRLTQQLERARQGGRGPGGQGGPGGRGMGGLFGGKKLAEMSADELTQFKDGLGMMDGMLERMRERLTEEQVKKIETNLETLKKSLADNKLDEAQKALDAMREAMPQRRRGGGGEGGGDAGGRAGGGGGRSGGGGGGGGR